MDLNKKSPRLCKKLLKIIKTKKKKKIEKQD